MNDQKEFNSVNSNSGFQQSDIAIKYYYFIMHIRFNHRIVELLIYYETTKPFSRRLLV